MFLLCLLVAIVFGGGCCIGTAIVDEHTIRDASIRRINMVMGIVFTVVGLTAFIGSFKTMGRNYADIDIDSFTEAEVHDKVEERWREIKNQINNPKI